MLPANYQHPEQTQPTEPPPEKPKEPDKPKLDDTKDMTETRYSYTHTVNKHIFVRYWLDGFSISFTGYSRFVGNNDGIAANCRRAWGKVLKLCEEHHLRILAIEPLKPTPAEENNTQMIGLRLYFVVVEPVAKPIPPKKKPTLITTSSLDSKKAALTTEATLPQDYACPNCRMAININKPPKCPKCQATLSLLTIGLANGQS